MERAGRLQGKVAVITGAASGIGRAAAELFAREQARLLIADYDDAGLKETLQRVEALGGEIDALRTDVSREQEVKTLIERALSRYSRVDVLCNNAGVVGDMAEPENQDASIWHRVLEVNLMGTVYGTKYVTSHMKEQRSGAIVNTSSVAGIRSGAGGNAYSASKAAIINFTQTSACDLGAFNIRVNAVCPGLIETGMTKPVFDYAREAGKEHKLGSRCELRRYGKPEEVARVIAFLASEDASYITGQALAVDGGNTASLNLPGMKL